MKLSFSGNAVALWMALAGLICLAAAGSAQAACAMEQTASNEIVIRVSAGGCDGAALRQNLAGAIGHAAAPAGTGVDARTVGAYSETKRSNAQGTLWRLANMNNQPVTSFTMPGGR
jgi:hypothetical protein